MGADISRLHDYWLDQQVWNGIRPFHTRDEDYNTFHHTGDNGIK